MVIKDWIMDSGAFTSVTRDGGYVSPPCEYAREIRRWSKNGNLLAAVAQDFMCEPWVLQRTNLSIPDHQHLTIVRYDELLAADPGVYVMPVLQGYTPSEYVDHVREYGARLRPGAWVGVGSVCKRNGSPNAIVAVLSAIKAERPDLRLHGFGLKQTALSDPRVTAMLHTSDSMAWSFAARREGRNANDYREALAYTGKINAILAATATRST